MSANNDAGDVHADADSIFITLPANRFFWSVIDTAGLPAQSRRDSRALGYVFENTLPLPLERIHAVYVETDDHRVVACGMLSEDLVRECERHPGMLSLVPESAPAFMASLSEQTLASLNFCSGQFEPKPVRSARRRVLVTVGALWLAIVAVVMAGLERRIAAEHRQSDALITARTQVLQQTLGPSAASKSQPLELRFIAELRTLRQTRQRQSAPDSSPLGTPNSAPTDAFRSFASFAQRWPRELNVLAESLSITPTAMTLRAVMPTSAEVQQLADALAAIPGWQSQQPQINATSDNQFNATLQWKRPAPAPHAASPSAQAPLVPVCAIGARVIEGNPAS